MDCDQGPPQAAPPLDQGAGAGESSEEVQEPLQASPSKKESSASLLRRNPFALLMRARGYTAGVKKAQGQAGHHKLALKRRDEKIRQRDCEIARLGGLLAEGAAFSEADIKLVQRVHKINDAMEDVVLSGKEKFGPEIMHKLVWGIDEGVQKMGQPLVTPSVGFGWQETVCCLNSSWNCWQETSNQCRYHKDVTTMQCRSASVLSSVLPETGEGDGRGGGRAAQ